MKYSKTNIIGDAGEHLLVARVIKLFGYPCRLNSIDIGIDAEIELIDSNYKSTGKFIKCQVKTTTDSGKTSLFLEEKHISYWNSIDIPVVVFLVHLDTEEIFWHCIDDISVYTKSESGYKVDFDSAQILKKENKEQFDEIALFPLVQQIQKIYRDAYTKASSDKEEFLDSGNHDLTTAEFFVRNFYEIRANLNKVEKLISKNPTLSKLKHKYSKEIGIIFSYLMEVEEIMNVIKEDHGYEYFSFLENEDFD